MTLKRFVFIVLIMHCTQLSAQRGLFSIDVLAGPSLYAFEKSDYLDFKQGFNYSYGLNIKFNIPIAENTLSFNSGYFISSKNYSRTFTNTSASSPQQINSDYTYGSVPFCIELKFNSKIKIYPFINMGIVFSNIISENYSVILKNGEVDNTYLNSFSSLEKHQRLHIGFGLELRASRVVLFRFEGTIDHQLNEGSSLKP